MGMLFLAAMCYNVGSMCEGSIMMRYPAYPLITIDPYVSIWSSSDQLNDDNTRLWFGMEKPIHGVMHIDGEHLRFMGAADPRFGAPQRTLPQKSVDFEPLVTRYVFENSRVRLTLSFWSPAILEDVQLMSTPCSFIDYELKVLDGRGHDISIELYVDSPMCGHDVSDVAGETLDCEGYSLARFGKRHQQPLHERGDGIDIDWGTFYLAGRYARYNEHGVAYNYNFTRKKAGTEDVSEFAARTLMSVYKLPHGFDGEIKVYDVFAYDDGYSLIVLGDMLKGVWTERFDTIDAAIDYFYKHHDELWAKTMAWQEKLLNDARPFGEDYVSIITCAYRQVLAAHKAVRRPDGELVYMSKECHSNGCINTVDVSYPSLPLLLCYNPELVRGLMTCIFDFANMPCWQYDFAPHDMGQYPIANGQVYGLDGEKTKGDPFAWLNIYKSSENLFNFKYQMPVEECGNMILMAYTYMRAEGGERSRAYIDKYMPTLRKWAQYLIDKGIDLDSQLCTDDFAGHMSRNVNLAIKACEALYAMGEMTGEDRYHEIARANAKQLETLAANDAGMMLALGNPDSWSLKYNMVWDTVAGFDLFSADVRKTEIATYVKRANPYGVPLDSRKEFTKSDWMMWASALDDTDENTRFMSKLLAVFLDNTRDRVPFTDWFETDTAICREFRHRTVQGGLWMPVLKAKWAN